MRFYGGFDLALSLTRSDLALYFLGLGLLGSFCLGLRGTLTGTLGFSDGGSVERFIVVSEGSSINLHNGRLGEGIGTNQLVVTWVV